MGRGGEEKANRKRGGKGVGRERLTGQVERRGGRFVVLLNSVMNALILDCM